MEGFTKLLLDGTVPKGPEIDTYIVKGSQFSHRQHIHMRLQFISQLFDNSKAAFDGNSLAQIWQIFFNIPQA